MMWLILLALVAICCYVYIKIKNWYNYWDRQGIKNVKPKSFLHLFGIQKDKSMHDVVRDMYNTFEERYFGMFNITPVLMIKDLELIKKITVKEFDSFQNHRQFAPSGVDPLWSKNVFDANGEEWKELRSVLSPSFTSSKMRGMFNLMQECAKAFTDYFLEQKKEVIDVEFKDIFSKYTNDVIATSAFGIRCNSLKEPKNTFFQMGKEAFDFSGLRFFRFFIFSVCPPIILKTLRLRLFPKRIAKFFKSIIQDTIKTREENNIIRPDMIHLLMQARKGIETKDEGFKGDVKEFSSVNEYNLGKSNSNKKIELTIDSIVSQAFIFFFGGFDTSSTAMSLIAYELAVDQDIQKRLREEIDRTYEECRGELTYEVLLNMKYLDMVVSETLRKWPPAPFMDRLTTKDFVIEPEKPTEKPVLVKKGSLVWIPVAGLHYDPKYFPNPTKFDPERFSDENKHNIIPTSYLPFGNGPRNCIGSRFALMTVKCVVFNLLRNFELVPTAKSQIPVKIKNTSLAIAAENGFNFGLKRRM